MRIYLDTSTLIDAVEGTGPETDYLRAIFKRASETGSALVTSELALSEVLVKPLAEVDQPRLTAYLILLSNDPGQQIAVHPVDRAILVQAAFVRVRSKGIKLPDAIHLATAERYGCTHIITRDMAWPGATQLPVVYGGPDELRDFLTRFA